MPRARTPITWPRPRIVWSPSWNDEVQCWTAAFLYRNQWRCDVIHGIDDLMQDAYLLFVKVSERYPRVITQQAFMKLYKASLRNMLHDHARRMMINPIDRVDIELLEAIGDTTNLGEVICELADLPPPIVEALKLLATKPELLLEGGKQRENLNKKLRRLLNFGSGFEFTRSLRTLLQES